MSDPNLRFKYWLRTTDGRLAILVAILAAAAIVAFFLRPPTEHDVTTTAAPAVSAQPNSLQTRMTTDLRAGMKHLDFLQKYGKPVRVERRPDGLLRLYYDDVTVTFDESGKPIETLVDHIK